MIRLFLVLVFAVATSSPVDALPPSCGSGDSSGYGDVTNCCEPYTPSDCWRANNVLCLDGSGSSYCACNNNLYGYWCNHTSAVCTTHADCGYGSCYDGTCYCSIHAITSNRYRGDHCETLCCSGNGACNSAGGCNCDKGWVGPQCQESINTCGEYIGTNCCYPSDQFIDACWGSSYSALCVDSNSVQYCGCVGAPSPYGYCAESGSVCETDNDCRLTECTSGRYGTSDLGSDCVVTSGDCIRASAPSPYGNLCDSPAPVCTTDNDCLTGSCIQGNCFCDNRHWGDNCGNQCCNGHGTCYGQSLGAPSPGCSCDANYYGKPGATACGDTCIDSSGTVCNGRGTCDMIYGCICTGDYSGKHCEDECGRCNTIGTAIDPNSLGPQCVSSGSNSNPVCECLSGYGPGSTDYFCCPSACDTGCLQGGACACPTGGGGLECSGQPCDTTTGTCTCADVTYGGPVCDTYCGCNPLGTIITDNAVHTATPTSATSSCNALAQCECTKNSGYGGDYCCKETNGLVCGGNDYAIANGTCMPTGICACYGSLQGHACSGIGTCNSVTGFCSCPAVAPESNGYVQYNTTTCCPQLQTTGGFWIDCGGHGTCKTTGGVTGCTCDRGYSGALCCPTCVHGTCGPQGECVCNFPYSGHTCEDESTCPLNSITGVLCSGSPCTTEPPPYSMTLWKSEGFVGSSFVPPSWASYDTMLGYYMPPSSGTGTPTVPNAYQFDRVVDNGEVDVYFATVYPWVFIDLTVGFTGVDPRTDPYYTSNYNQWWYTFGDAVDSTWTPRPAATRTTVRQVYDLIRWFVEGGLNEPGHQWFDIVSTQKNAGTLAPWVEAKIQHFNPDQGHIDPAYRDNVVMLLNTSLVGLNFSTTHGANASTQHVSGILNMMLYSARLDPLTGRGPTPLPWVAPTHCACAAGVYSPKSWESDCALSCTNGTMYTPNPVECTGYQYGVFHGACNHLTGLCECATHWGGDQCTEPYSLACFDGSTPGFLACSSHGTCPYQYESGGATINANCTCDLITAGSRCQYFVCSVNYTNEADRMTECNNHGTCNPNGICTCDVLNSLHASGQNPNHRPYLPMGPNCDINGAALCASFVLSTTGVGTWQECTNQGHCAPNVGCVCDIGWTGPLCTIPTCAAVGGCNEHQTCLQPQGSPSCVCNPLRLTDDPSNPCSVNQCGNGVANGTSCVCDTGWSKDTSGFCTVMQCPLATVTDEGEIPCPDGYPTCVGAQDPHINQCCQDLCPSHACTMNATTGVKQCQCNPAFSSQPVSTQTDGICHSICHGQTYTPSGGPHGVYITCTCYDSYYLDPPWNATSDVRDATCLRTRCINGKANSGHTACICNNGYQGLNCSTPSPSSSAGTSSTGHLHSSSSISSPSSSSTGVHASLSSSSSSATGGHSVRSSSARASSSSSTAPGRDNSSMTLMIGHSVTELPLPIGVGIATAAAVVSFTVAVFYAFARMCPARRALFTRLNT